MNRLLMYEDEDISFYMVKEFGLPFFHIDLRAKWTVSFRKKMRGIIGLIRLKLHEAGVPAVYASCDKDDLKTIKFFTIIGWEMYALVNNNTLVFTMPTSFGE